MNKLTKTILTTFVLSTMIINTGCVQTNYKRQSAAAKACRSYGGTVTYNTFSVSCRMPSGRGFTTY